MLVGLRFIGTLTKKPVKIFLVFVRNRLISGGLEPVLIHTKKIMSINILYSVFYEYKNVQL